MGFSLEELRTGLSSAGGEAGQVASGIVSGARKALCQAYSAYPGWVSGSVADPLGFVSGYRRALLDGICDGLQPEGPIPVKPFTGGQCAVPYYVTVSYFRSQRSGPSGFFTCELVAAGSNFVTLAGPITGVFDSGVQGGPGGRYVEVFARTSAYPDGVSVGTLSLQFYDLSSNDGTSCQEYKYVLSFQRVDGLPDNCGDPGETYNGGGSPPGDEIVSTHPFVVDRDDGTQVTLSPTFRISPRVSFSPSLRIPVQICLLSGVCYQAGDDGLTETGGGISAEDLEALLEGAQAAKDALDQALDLTKDVPTTGEEKPEGGDDNEDNEVEDLLGIFVNVSTIPAGFGREFGIPEKFDLGRVSFRKDGFYIQDAPLTFAAQYFPAPPEANGYAVHYSKGVRARVTVLKRERDE
jgi:hypothetical protein